MITVSQIGIHSIGDKRGNKNEYKTCLQTIYASGRQLSLVKCRDDFGAIDDPLDLWPNMVTIGAMTAWDDDPSYDPKTAFKRIAEAARKNPKIKYWEYFNEREDVERQIVDFYIGLVPMLHDAGLRLCAFNSSSGRPQYPEIDPAPYREIARFCEFVKRNKYDVIIGQHEYSGDENTIGRYKHLADYLQARGLLLPIAITEWGWPTNDGKEQKYFEWMKANDPVYIGDDRLIGLATYTLGGRGWQASNFATILPQLGEYIATVQPATPQPPAPPPDPLTHEARITALEGKVRAIEAMIGGN